MSGRAGIRQILQEIFPGRCPPIAVEFDPALVVVWAAMLRQTVASTGALLAPRDEDMPAG
jgi:hypothetical protein